MKPMLLLVLFAAVGSGQDKLAIVGFGEPRLRCHDHSVRLEGRLVRRWFYGPSGFGETPKQDAREEVFVLNLTHPITVFAPPNPGRDETCEDLLPGVSQVQVWGFQEKQKILRQNVGKLVTITGTLDEDPAPGAHLRVQITPESIQVK